MPAGSEMRATSDEDDAFGPCTTSRTKRPAKAPTALATRDSLKAANAPIAGSALSKHAQEVKWQVGMPCASVGGSAKPACTGASASGHSFAAASGHSGALSRYSSSNASRASAHTPSMDAPRGWVQQTPCGYWVGSVFIPCAWLTDKFDETRLDEAMMWTRYYSRIIMAAIPIFILFISYLASISETCRCVRCARMHEARRLAGPSGHSSRAGTRLLCFGTHIRSLLAKSRPNLAAR
jgi:hypothetical protein